MDLIYLPDSICYPFHLTSLGRNNRTWEDVNEISAKDNKREQTECSKDKKNCSICKSRQKRSLSTYIRKTRRDSEKDKFAEEDEEQEDCSRVEKRVSNDSPKEKSSAALEKKCNA